MPDPASTAVAVPITVTFTDALGGTGTFDGTMMIQRVVKSGGGLAAVGTVTGTATDSTGAGVGTVTNRAVTVPLQATRTCDILHLTLGPLDLTLLGLVVHLDQVVLDITAEQAPGISWATCCARSPARSIRPRAAAASVAC